MGTPDPELVEGAAPVPAPPSPGAGQKPQTATKVRTQFPETWLWSESATGYHMTLSVFRAAKLTRCACQKYLRSFVAIWWKFSIKISILLYFRQIL